MHGLISLHSSLQIPPAKSAPDQRVAVLNDNETICLGRGRLEPLRTVVAAVADELPSLPQAWGNLRNPDARFCAQGSLYAARPGMSQKGRDAPLTQGRPKASRPKTVRLTEKPSPNENVYETVVNSRAPDNHICFSRSCAEAFFESRLLLA
jgi:hypothetical protein